MPRIIDLPVGTRGAGSSTPFWNAQAGQTQRAVEDFGGVVLALDSDFIVNNQVVPLPVPAFDIEIGSGEVWSVEGRLWMSQTTGASPPNGFRYNFSGGSVSGWRANGTYAGGTQSSTQTITTDNVLAISATGVRFHLLQAIVESADGTVRFSFAQNAAHASDTILRQGSVLVWTRIA